VDEFIADLERLDLLSDDPVAMAALRGDETRTSHPVRPAPRGNPDRSAANRIRQMSPARDRRLNG
jgi:hypothetical protein